MPTPRSSNRSFTNLRASDQIEKAATALDALETEPEIVAAMAPRKYTPEDQIGKGRALLEAVTGSVDDQTEDHGDRLTSTRRQMDLLAGARDLYAPLAATARAVFTGEPDVLAALGLKGSHLKSYAARIERMRGFVVEARKPERLARFADETEIDGQELDDLEAALAAAEAGMSTQGRTWRRRAARTRRRRGRRRSVRWRRGCSRCRGTRGWCCGGVLRCWRCWACRRGGRVAFRAYPARYAAPLLPNYWFCCLTNCALAQSVLAPDPSHSLAMSVQELETAIMRLPPDQLSALGEWFDEYRAEGWDRQIEHDAKGGKLDSLVHEAVGDIVAGRVRPLP